jgi:hypothetical protein
MNVINPISSKFLLDDESVWIKKDGEKYQFLFVNFISYYFPSLVQEHKVAIMDQLTKLLNLIFIKYDLYHVADIFWNRLLGNSMLELRSMLSLILPYILDDDKDEKKKKLTDLSELYLKKDTSQKYLYTNVQYSRCIREIKGIKTRVIFRPFLVEYLEQNLELLLMSVESCLNKLYINWIEICPVAMDEFPQSPMYLHTLEKLQTGKTQINLINSYIDPLPGLSIQEMYQTLVNLLYYNIKPIKWLIYDVRYGSDFVPYVTYLEKKIDIGPLWENISWGHLQEHQRNLFAMQWKSFLQSHDEPENIILIHFNYFYHSSQYGELIEEEEDEIKVTNDKIQEAKSFLEKASPEHIYSFWYDQMVLFKGTWYYYVLRIKKVKYISVVGDIRLTLKNIYNYAKSMSHFFYRNRYTPLPRYWNSLQTKYVEKVVCRIFDIEHPEHNNWKNNEAIWFNISNYISAFYRVNNIKSIRNINKKISKAIHQILPDVLFETLIYHGLLSELVLKPKKKSESYYYLTHTTYSSIQNGQYIKKLLQSDRNWNSLHTLHWINQINFYHHYFHNRIIFVSGATGVGKSTQLPKLLFYSLYAFEYKDNGKVICTQPRIEPTEMISTKIAEELGVPIQGDQEEVEEGHYYVQFQHSHKSHTEKTRSYIKFMTDGLFFEQLKNTSFLSSSNSNGAVFDNNNNRLNWVKMYTQNPIYDIITVDEAHEHNINIDMILTLMRNIIYINNKIKLIISSATLNEDEPLYRRFFRPINDNRSYPLSAYIEKMELDRCNVDRRIHIAIPGMTTPFPIVDHFLSPEEAKKITLETYVHEGIQKTIEIIRTTKTGNILLFLAGQTDILRAVKEINQNSPSNVICFGFYSELSELERKFVSFIHDNLPNYTRYKEDIYLPEKEVTRRVPPKTYTRAVIAATNIAEASITFPKLKYVVDTGFAKINIYDYIEEIDKLETMPISYSSSLQRRGRVGRLEEGEVFYLYSLEQISKNKPIYKIANANIKDILVSLINSQIMDTQIIYTNDINYVPHLEAMHFYQKNQNINPLLLLFQVLKNPIPYLSIILNQYMYLPKMEDLNNYYSYYGKVNHQLEDIDFQNIRISSYVINNHDDYQTHKYVSYPGRGYTGFLDIILEDNDLSFYLIHPDEDIIQRNEYTGELEAIKENPIISKDYYIYLLAYNGLETQTKVDEWVLKRKIEYGKFRFYKTYQAFQHGLLDMSLISIPSQNVPSLFLRFGTIEQENLPDINRALEITNNYQKKMADIFRKKKSFIIKSPFYTIIDSYGKFLSMDYLQDYQSLLWFSFSLSYQLEDSILALIILLQLAPNINDWVISKDPQNIDNFMLLHKNFWGDIYFLWNIWMEIRKEFKKNHISIPRIQDLYPIFQSQKTAYLKAQIDSKTQKDIYILFTNLRNSGRLNTVNEFYYYIQGLRFPGNIKYQLLDALSERLYLNKSILRKFTTEYLENLFLLNKKHWLLTYEEENPLLWIQEHLHFSPYFPGKEEWFLVLETYIRAYSTQLLLNRVDYYLRLDSSTKFQPYYPYKNLDYENTLLNQPSDYLIYHHTNEIRDRIIISYLTFVKAEWVFELNPIYYYYYFYERKTIIPGLPSIFYAEAEQIIRKKKMKYNISSLIAYLDQLNNKQITELMRPQLLKN